MLKFFHQLAITLAVVFGLTAALPCMSQERWHAASYIMSELRGEAIALVAVHPSAARRRPFIDTLSYGLHSDMDDNDGLSRIGVDVVAMAPQIGVGPPHGWWREGFNVVGSDLKVRNSRAFSAKLSAENAKPIELAKVEVRSFAETQFGVETLARFGADVFFVGRDAPQLRLRDVITGQPYKSAGGPVRPDVEFMLGVDVAHDWSSQYLASSDRSVGELVRFRGRAGMPASVPQADIVYGVTWFTPEFEGPPGGQMVGFLNVNLRF